MLRIIGAACVGISAAAMGFRTAAQMRRRLTVVTAFRDALLSMQQKITYYHTPLPQMLRELAVESREETAAFFAHAAVMLEENRTNTAETVLCRCLREDKSLMLPEEAEARCLRLFRTLGWMDGANQAEAIARAVREFDELVETLRTEHTRRGRCVCLVSVCAGLAAAILLL